MAGPGLTKNRLETNWKCDLLLELILRLPVVQVFLFNKSRCCEGLSVGGVTESSQRELFPYVILDINKAQISSLLCFAPDCKERTWLTNKHSNTKNQPNKPGTYHMTNEIYRQC